MVVGGYVMILVFSLVLDCEFEMSCLSDYIRYFLFYSWKMGNVSQIERIVSSYWGAQVYTRD